MLAKLEATPSTLLGVPGFGMQLLLARALSLAAYYVSGEKWCSTREQFRHKPLDHPLSLPCPIP